MMGAGKSKIGRALAERLELTFADTDADIVARTGHTIADLFSADGEAAFRILEREGTAGLAGISGMVGLAYLEAGRLTLARDRYGIKPLLYERDGDGIRFASELPARLAGRAGTPRRAHDPTDRLPMSPRGPDRSG